MTDSPAGSHPSENLPPQGIEHDLDIMDSALAALDSDDLEAAEALVAELGGAPAAPSPGSGPSPAGGGSEQPSADRPS